MNKLAHNLINVAVGVGVFAGAWTLETVIDDGRSHDSAVCSDYDAGRIDNSQAVEDMCNDFGYDYAQETLIKDVSIAEEFLAGAYALTSAGVLILDRPRSKS